MNLEEALAFKYVRREQEKEGEKDEGKKKADKALRREERHHNPIQRFEHYIALNAPRLISQCR